MGEYELDRYENTGKQTVVVVHGTQFNKDAATADGKIAWWQPGSDFVNRLNSALDKRKTTARCWAHLADGEGGFEWSGANDWHARSEAADRLREYVKTLQANGWIVHLVGHSHGGNVILEAVANTNKEIADWFNGRICLLGTPVFNNTAIFHDSQKRLMVSGLIFAIVMALVCTWIFSPWDARPVRELIGHTGVGPLFLLGVPAIGALLLAFKFIERKVHPEQRTRMLLDGSSVRTGSARTPQIMLINCKTDEAYKLLKSLNPSNPRSLKGGMEHHSAEKPRKIDAIWAILKTSHRSAADASFLNIQPSDRLIFAGIVIAIFAVSALGQRMDAALPVLAGENISTGETAVWLTIWIVANILGFLFWRRLLRVVSLPFSYLHYGIQFAKKVGSGVFATAFRDQIISTTKNFLRQLAYGFLGGPVTTRQVDIGLQPNAREGNWIYLELPESTVSSVRERQSPHFQGLVDEIYEMSARNDAFASLMKLAGKIDMPLVHNVYHGDSDCVDRIAGWINAGKDSTLARSSTRKTTTVNSGGVGMAGDHTTYPYNVFWESALIDLFKPEEGWQCVLPTDIQLELELNKYWEATVPRCVSLFRLHEAMNEDLFPRKSISPGVSQALRALSATSPPHRRP